eukprot:NODE_21_length_38511_cov_0.503306.p14 type:complete len:125 gc:universal NODE_21_length_38511_cov_0.503306:37141-37515(+)
MGYGIYQHDIEELSEDVLVKDVPEYVQLVSTEVIKNKVKVVHVDGTLSKKHGIPFYIENKGEYKKYKEELLKKLGNTQFKIYNANQGLYNLPKECIKDDEIVENGNYIAVDHPEKKSVNKITIG